MPQRIARRQFIRGAAAGVLAPLVGRSALSRAAEADAPRTRPAVITGGAGRPEWRLRPELVEPDGGGELEIIQITGDPEIPSSHVYMEAQIFTPDSRRFVLHRSAHPHGSDPKDPRHHYLRCDLDDNLSLHPLTDELGPTAPSVSPDGRVLYYFVDQTYRKAGQRFALKRVNLDGTERSTILVIDGLVPGTRWQPRRPYPLSTISSDGRRLAISALFRDTSSTTETFGLMVFDLERASVELVLQGETWCNMHPQFCRSTDPELRRDILVQENHGCEADADGKIVRLTGGEGADIHVIRDDGTNLRDLPWGRDGNEFCQGHQCWRGRTGWAITSTVLRQEGQERLIESRPVPHVGHVGLKRPDGVRNELSRSVDGPHFFHFATDIEGKRFISDFGPFGPGQRVCVARLNAPGEAPLSDLRFVACPKSSGRKEAHTHPFLSPDGRTGFFNSDESGTLQAYLVRGFA